MQILFEGEGLEFQKLIRYPTFQVFSQKVTFFTGPSGIGKSTLFRMFNRTIAPTAGKLYYRGKPITEYSPILLRREVLLISQEIFLFSGSIYENFRRFYEYRDLPVPEEDQIKKWLALCALSISPDASCDSLSGGERQRVMLAIYLSFSPSVLLLDEPTSALDLETASVLLNNLISHAKQVGMTPIIVSHAEELVTQFAEDQILLERGDMSWERSN